MLITPTGQPQPSSPKKPPCAASRYPQPAWHPGVQGRDRGLAHWPSPASLPKEEAAGRLHTALLSWRNSPSLEIGMVHHMKSCSPRPGICQRL